MSDSPGPGGDADNVNGEKISRLRPAEEDSGIDAVPAKAVKIDESDEVVALDEDEYDEEEEEDPEGDLELDGEDEEEDGDLDAVNEENIFDETGESSTDMDEFIQANLAYIEDCQTDIDSLNQKANDEILKVEQKYNKLRQPVYTRRNNYIERIPHFWASVFTQHPQLKRVLTKEDIRCLRYCTHLQIDDFEDTRSGYSIKFRFAENPWFSNTTITKEYHMPWNDSPSCYCTAIEWKPGHNLTKKPSSFFSWFCAQEDASSDDIAEIIREELWPSPLQNYTGKELVVDSGSEDESDEGSTTQDEGPVYIADDAPEYISSDEDEEEWKTRRVQGKEVPGGSSKDDFFIIDDEDDGDFEEGLEEDVVGNEDNLGYDDVIDGDSADFDGEGNDDVVVEDQIDITSKDSVGDGVDLTKNNPGELITEQGESNDVDTNVSSSRDSTSLKSADVEQVMTSSDQASPSKNGTTEEMANTGNEAVPLSEDT